MGVYASCNATQNFPISINIPMSIISWVPFAAVFVNKNKPERIAAFIFSKFLPILWRRLRSTHCKNQYCSQGECRILLVTYRVDLIYYQLKDFLLLHLEICNIGCIGSEQFVCHEEENNISLILIIFQIGPNPNSLFGPKLTITLPSNHPPPSTNTNCFQSTVWKWIYSLSMCTEKDSKLKQSYPILGPPNNTIEFFSLVY